MDCGLRDILGVPVRPLTMRETVALATRAIERREPLLFGVVNAAKIVNMRADAELRAAVLAANVIVADGMSVVWAARLLGRPLPERVAGIDLMTELLAEGDRRRWRVFLLGATQEVLDEVRRRVAVQYPKVVIAGSRNGYFAARDDETVAAEIAATRADVLFAAMSSPKKELFLARWQSRMGIPVCHGVGGAFDVLAGVVRRAPRVWQALGCEWLYRLLQEPGRLWKRYLVTNARFTGLVLRAWLASWFGRGLPMPGAPEVGRPAAHKH
ncbi:MAG: WecB/TagA/CpsF family glycosyltransferase [Phycisphaerae bacterium]